MTDKEIAELAGVTLDDIVCLRRGSAKSNLANRLGVTIDDLDQFLKGKGTEGMRRSLSLPTLAQTDELACKAVPIILQAITRK